MKISAIDAVSKKSGMLVKKQVKPKQKTNDNYTNGFLTCPSIKINRTELPKMIYFQGQKVHIVDGGNHASNLEHFAKALDDKLETKMHDVEVNKKDKNTKQLKSLEQQLKLMNTKDSYQEEYIAIPVLASASLLNIQDQYNIIMNENKKFTPENIKANKTNVLSFLEKLYKNPIKYQRYIKYLDPIDQGIEYTWGVIQEINKLIDKGARVYVPSGHPQDDTLKWLAKERGLSEELYYFIETHKDPGGKITKLHQEIKDKNWYDFNLLSLCDANIVGVKDTEKDSWTSKASDYLFNAYDSCITDGARGVYNFSPVRHEGKLVGYSYTDTTHNEYPYDEFPANDEVENIAKFVGLRIDDVLASEEEIEELYKKKKANLDTSDCADKLYPVDWLYTGREIKENKIDLQGQYVDKTLKLFFKTNRQGEVIFPKCDCEGSGKPSVLPMWGSCFSVFSAIVRDIRKQQDYSYLKSEESIHKAYIEKLLKKAEQSGYIDAQMYLNDAINKDSAYAANKKIYWKYYQPHFELAKLHLEHNQIDYAQSCCNNALNILAKNYFLGVKHPAIDPSDVGNLYSLYRIHLVPKIASKMYEFLAKTCMLKGEKYPARVCLAAARDLEDFNNRGRKVMEMRAQGIQYIGDLYNEIKPD